MSLLDMFNEQQTKTASAVDEQELEKQAADMYSLGADLAIHQLKVAAEEATGSKDSDGDKDGSTSEEEYKEKRKAQLINEMKASPDKKEEIKKEVSGS